MLPCLYSGKKSTGFDDRFVELCEGFVQSRHKSLHLQVLPQKVFGPSWHPPQTPSQKVLGGLGKWEILET